MVVLLTGPSAAGKTTIGQLLAERFERGVHLEGDLFCRAIVSGHAELTPDADGEALAQLELRYRIAAAAADEYAAAAEAALEGLADSPILRSLHDSIAYSVRRSR